MNAGCTALFCATVAAPLVAATVAVGAALRAGCAAPLCGTDDEDGAPVLDGCQLPESGCPALPCPHASHLEFQSPEAAPPGAEAGCAAPLSGPLQDGDSDTLRTAMGCAGATKAANRAAGTRAQIPTERYVPVRMCMCVVRYTLLHGYVKTPVHTVPKRRPRLFRPGRPVLKGGDQAGCQAKAKAKAKANARFPQLRPLGAKLLS